MSTTEIFPISWGGTRQRGGTGKRVLRYLFLDEHQAKETTHFSDHPIEQFYSKDKGEEKMKFLQRIKAISSFNSSKSRRKLNSQSNNQRWDIKTFNFENGNTFQSKRSSIQNEIVEANNFLDRNLKNKIRISKYFRYKILQKFKIHFNVISC